MDLIWEGCQEAFRLLANLVVVVTDCVGKYADGRCISDLSQCLSRGGSKCGIGMGQRFDQIGHRRFGRRTDLAERISRPNPLILRSVRE